MRWLKNTRPGDDSAFLASTRLPAIPCVVCSSFDALFSTNTTHSYVVFVAVVVFVIIQHILLCCFGSLFSIDSDIEYKRKISMLLLFEISHVKIEDIFGRGRGRASSHNNGSEGKAEIFPFSLLLVLL